MSKKSNVFTVDSIVGHQITRGKDFYKVHWLGYSKNEDTWEPIENLKNCQNLVEKFMDEKFAQERRRSLRHHRDLSYFSSDDEGHNTSKSKGRSGNRKTTIKRSTRASATPSKKATKDDSIRSGSYYLRSGNTEFSSEDESFVADKGRSSKKTRMTLSESRFKKQLANIKKDIYKSSPYKTSTPQVSPSKTSETDSPSKIQATKRLQFGSAQRIRTRTVDTPPMMTRRRQQRLEEDITVSEEPPTVAEADDSEEEEVEPRTKYSTKKVISTKPKKMPVSKVHAWSGDDETEEEQCFPVTWKEFALGIFVTGLAGLGYLCYTTDYCRYC